MIATLLLLASLLGAGPAPSPPVATPIAVGHRYQLPATTAATRRAAALGTLACRPATARAAHGARGAVRARPGGAASGRDRHRTAGGDQRRPGAGRPLPLPALDRRPTGLISVNQPGRRRLGQLFRIWGQPLGDHRLLGFRSHTPLRAFVDGRAWHHGVRRIPLRDRSEIVIELGRLIPPHSFYLFPEQA